MVEGKTALFIGRRKPAGSARQKPTALFIGRFQPLHKGHLFALRYIAKRSARVLVVIGSSQEKGTRKNPFSARQRKKMLEAVIAAEKLSGKGKFQEKFARSGAQTLHSKCKVFMLRDIPEDGKWVAHLDARVPEYDVCYSNNALVLKLMRAAGKEVARVPMLSRAKYRGKLVRGRMRAGKEWQSRVPSAVGKRLSGLDAGKR